MSERYSMVKESAIGPYMGKDPDGAWLQYADRAAEVAALTEQVAQADRANGELLRRLQAAEDETHRLATELGDKKCLGLETIQRLDDKIIALTERAERAEKANALLRAECEAWRAWQRRPFPLVGEPSTMDAVYRAIIATDAAKALGPEMPTGEPKGGE